MIRLSRTGSKKQAHYRVVVCETKQATESRFVEIVGHYNPRTMPATVKVHHERVEHWLKAGRAAVRRRCETLLARHVDEQAAEAAAAGRRRRPSEPRARRRGGDRPRAGGRSRRGRVTETEHRGDRGHRAVRGAGRPRARHRPPGAHGLRAAHAGGRDGEHHGEKATLEIREPAPGVTDRGRRPPSGTTFALVGRVARAHGNRGAGDRQPGHRLRRGAVPRGRRCSSAAPRGGRVGGAARHGDARPPRTADHRARGRRDDERRRGAGRPRVADARRRSWSRCPTGVFYRHDLVGCRVETTGGERGRRGDRGRGRAGDEPAGRAGRRAARC